jgi:hypothetical protein
MNIKKLVKWNLNQPYSKRIAADELAEQVGVARDVANVRALHRQIRGEVEAKLASMPSWDNVD